MKRHQQLLLFYLLFGTMVLFGLIENIKGVSYPLIKAEFNASWEQQGLLVSVLSLSYVGFSVIAGIFLGRFGIKPAFLCGFTALILGMGSIFFMPSFFTATISLLIVFAGFGFFEIGLNALATQVFITKTALLMNLLHAFYGLGSVIGPRAAGFITNNGGLGWRYIYLLSLPAALILFIPGIVTKFPEDRHSNSGPDLGGGSVKRKSFFDALGSRMVWLFSAALGLGVIIEMNSANWGPLYFQDVYSIDPRTGGAAFLSIFFTAFTLSRLICGVFVERIGYIRLLIGIVVIISVFFIVGICLGARGIYVLPALGFFVALLWPTIMALAIVNFGKDAAVMTSAMIAIGGTINAVVQFLIGLTNRIFGPAWGYRSTLIYALLLIGVLIVIRKKVNYSREAARSAAVNP